MAAIDIGSTASDRGSYTGGAYTRIDLNNAANDSGFITSVEFWFDTADVDAAGVIVGAFYLVSGTDYACRDYATIGAVTKGSKQTFSSLTGHVGGASGITVVAGDFIGFYCTAGSIETDTSGGGLARYLGDATGGTQTYVAVADRTMSIYGAGATPVRVYEDIASRFKLIAQVYKDIASRFSVISSRTYKDISSRFKVTAQTYIDIASRFALSIPTQVYKDIASRFFLVAATKAYKDIASRFKLRGHGYKDIASRFFLAVSHHLILEGNYYDRTRKVSRILLTSPYYAGKVASETGTSFGERLRPIQSNLIVNRDDATRFVESALAKSRFESNLGQIVILPNCGQELYDVIGISDRYGRNGIIPFRVASISVNDNWLTGDFNEVLILTEV